MQIRRKKEITTSEQELKKEFLENWKEKNQTKYLVMQIFSIVEWIPWLIAGYLVFCADAKENLFASVVCFVFGIAFLAIKYVLAKDKNLDWKKYLDKNKSKLS